jgi:lipoprotein NlpD
LDTSRKPVPKPTTAAVTPKAEKKPVTVTPAATKLTNTPVSRWLWPATGTVSRRFAGDRNKGLDLVGQRGDPVVATADGVVVYAGSGVTGYGALLIVKHNDTYLSAYGHNDALLVNEGAFVAAGETIAQMGSTSAESVKLHFEIRRNGVPIDPMTLLPSR